MVKTLIVAIGVVLGFCASFAALAGERKHICARYETEDGTSDGYKVEAEVLKGSELNTATRSYDYQAYSTYVVIFWNKDQATIIELDSPWLTAFDTHGVDQRGVEWTVSTTTTFCY